MFRKVLYSRFVSIILKSVLSCFYDKKYIGGKFFDQYRMGFGGVYVLFQGRFI